MFNLHLIIMAALLITFKAYAVEISDQPIIISAFAFDGSKTSRFEGVPTVSYGFNVLFDKDVKSLLKEFVVTLDAGEACSRITRINGKPVDIDCDLDKIVDSAYVRLSYNYFKKLEVDFLIGKQETRLIAARTSIFSPTYNVKELKQAYGFKLVLDTREENALIDKIEFFIAENSSNNFDNEIDLNERKSFGVVVSANVLEKISVSASLASLNKNEDFKSITIDYKGSKLGAYVSLTDYTNNPDPYGVDKYNQIGVTYDLFPSYQLHANYTRALEQKDVFQVTAPLFVSRIGKGSSYIYVALTAARTYYDNDLKFYTGLEDESTLMLNIYLSLDGPLKRLRDLNSSANNQSMNLNTFSLPSYLEP